jgi:hypothetical protein
MKYIYILALLITTSIGVNAQYFEASVKKNGSNLEFYIRPKVGGTDITNFKFENIDMFIRWPNTVAAPVVGTPVPNTVNFPGLTIANLGNEQYGSEPGFTNMEFSSPSSNSTTTPTTYVAGTQYLVFSVPVSNAISDEIQIAADNDNGFPYYLTLTRNTAGIGGTGDFTSHNPALGGNISLQLFYGLPAQLSSSGTLFYQKVGTGVVPVRFSSFTVTKNGNDALLNFTVQNETAVTDHYEVERSVDGYTFEKVKLLAKLNNGNSTNVYDVIDYNLSSIKNSGIIYYRIKQLDTDGRSAYTEIRYVRMSDKGGLISVYPNPAKEFTMLKVDAAEEGDINITLVNAEGRQLQTTVLKAQKGINLKRIDMANLPAGTYMLRAMISGELKTIGVIKL